MFYVLERKKINEIRKEVVGERPITWQSFPTYDLLFSKRTYGTKLHYTTFA